jgi:ABC-type branched-subunit amino acid transport system ATPase component
MTNVLTFPARRKSIVTAAQLASIQSNYSIVATNLEQLRDRLVDMNSQLEASRLEIAAGLAYSARSLAFDECEGQSGFGEQGSG